MVDSFREWLARRGPSTTPTWLSKSRVSETPDEDPREAD